MSTSKRLSSSRVFFAAMLCAVALLASACGGSAAESSIQVSDDEESGETNDAEAPATSSEPAEATESPLADLLGIPLGDDDAAQEYFAELSREAEFKIAECMLAQGFEYQVNDFSAFDSFDDLPDFESREFAEEYGFGIASNPFEQSPEAFEAFVDPNQEYRESLSPGELEAFELALNGEPPEADEDFQNFQPGGCQGEAFEEAFSFFQVFEEFGDEFDAIEEAYEADPRIVGSSTGWSGCMSEAGHTYSDQEGAQSDIQQRYNDILSNSDGFAVAPDPLDGDSDSEPVEVPFGPPTLDPESQALVDELAAEERIIAVASWDCNEPLREIEDEVRLEYEQRFVDENGSAIRQALDE